MRLLIIAVHVLAFACASSIPLAIWNGTLFSWHPTLMALAFLGLMAEGVLTSILFRTKDGHERMQAIQRHLVWQLLAFVCILGGFYVIYTNKVIHGKRHFQSLHAKFGLATFILAVIAPLGGLISFRKLGLLQRFPDKLQPRIKWLHRNVGLLTWILALVTIELTLTHHAVWKGGINRFWQAGVAAVGAAMVALAMKVPQSMKGRMHSILPMYGVVFAADEAPKAS